MLLFLVAPSVVAAFADALSSLQPVLVSADALSSLWADHSLSELSGQLRSGEARGLQHSGVLSFLSFFAGDVRAGLSLLIVLL